MVFNKWKANANALKLPTVVYKNNTRTKEIVFDITVRLLLYKNHDFNSRKKKWMSLPVLLHFDEIDSTTASFNFLKKSSTLVNCNLIQNVRMQIRGLNSVFISMSVYLTISFAEVIKT